MHNFRQFPQFALFWLVLMPAGIAHSASIDLTPSSSSQIQFIGTQKSAPLTAKESNSIELTGPALVTSADRIPVLLVPVHGTSSRVELDPPAIKDAVAALNQREASKILSTLMVEISSIQSLVRKNHIQEASEKLAALQIQYPNVAYLEFIKGSLLLLEGKKNEARTAVELGLASHPDSQEGLNFLSALGGGKKRSIAAEPNTAMQLPSAPSSQGGE